MAPRLSGSSFRPARLRPMEDRDVVREPGALQRSRDGRSSGPERIAQERRGLLRRGEVPEAMEHAEPEAAGEERTAPLAPGAVSAPRAQDPRADVAAGLGHPE